jgi:hypothetical protein
MTDNLAGASPVDQPVRPHAQDLTGDVAWLWTHCRALGMARRSDSGLMRDDVALFVADLHAVLRELVALEDMRLRLRSLHERGHGTDYEHYHKGLKKAWDAARAVLLGSNVRVEPAPTAKETYEHL